MSVPISRPQKITRQENWQSRDQSAYWQKRACMVCRITLPDRSGKGILIGQNLIMTNKCVINSQAAADLGHAIFLLPESQEPVKVQLQPNHFFLKVSEQAGFVIVSIASHSQIQKISHLAYSIFETKLHLENFIPMERIYQAISHPHLEEIAWRYVQAQVFDDQNALDNYIKTFRYKPKHQVVMCSLAKRIWDDSCHDVEKMKLFFYMLGEDDRDQLDSYRVELILACLNACPDMRLEQHVWEEYKIADSIKKILDYKYEYIKSAKHAPDGLINAMKYSIRAYMQVKSYIEKESNSYRRWFSSHFDAFGHQEKLPLVQLVGKVLNRNSLFCIREAGIQCALTDYFKRADQAIIYTIIQVIRCAIKDPTEVSSACCVIELLAPSLEKKDAFYMLKSIQSPIPKFSDFEGIQKDLHVCAIAVLKALVQKHTTPDIFDWIEKAIVEKDPNYNFWLFQTKNVFENRPSDSKENTVFETLAMLAPPSTFPCILNLIQKGIDESSMSSSCFQALEIVVKRLDETIIPKSIEWALRSAQLYREDKIGEFKDLIKTFHQKMVQVTIAEMFRWIKENLGKGRNLSFAFKALVSNTDPQFILPLFQQAIETDPDLDVLGCGIEELNQFPGIVSRILKSLTDQDSIYSESAYKVLENYAEKCDEKEIGEIVLWIEKYLEENTTKKRKKAVLALKAITPKVNVKDLLPLVKNVLLDEIRHISGFAGEILKRFHPHSLEEIIAILNFIKEVHVLDSQFRSLMVIEAFAHFTHLKLQQTADPSCVTQEINKLLTWLLEMVHRTESFERDKEFCEIFCRTFCTLAPYATDKNLPRFLAIIKSSLVKGLDKKYASYLLKILGQNNEKFAFEILQWYINNIQEITNNNSCGMACLTKLVHMIVDKTQILNFIKLHLNKNSTSAVNEFAASVIDKIAPSIDAESIDTFLELIQKCIGFEESVRSEAILALGKLEHKWMAYVLSRPEYELLKPIILEYQLSQSIPILAKASSRVGQ